MGLFSVSDAKALKQENYGFYCNFCRDNGITPLYYCEDWESIFKDLKKQRKRQRKN